jgi:3-dehydro-L-gulonate 2-dehydrogenase
MEIRIPYENVKETLMVILDKYNFSPEKAALCVKLFVQASLDGVPSHGLDRFPVFIDMIKNELVKPEVDLDLVFSIGIFERWHGNFGPGPSNAFYAMERAIQLSKEFGIGLVALEATNHWMRAGNFGLQAVEAGCIGICFTNTKPNMPAWGGSEPKLGNNPLVIAIPRKKGHILLDMALSQFSYGKMNTFFRRGEDMPFEAGFDGRGKLSKSPAEIIDKELALPIGLWKGAGLSLLLDMLASILSGGLSTHEVGKKGEEYGLSQIFLCLDPIKLGMEDWSDQKLDAIINDLKLSKVFEGQEVRYPGERIMDLRKRNLKLGVPVHPDIWEKIINMLK